MLINYWLGNEQIPDLIQDKGSDTMSSLITDKTDVIISPSLTALEKKHTPLKTSKYSSNSSAVNL